MSSSTIDQAPDNDFEIDLRDLHASLDQCVAEIEQRDAHNSNINDHVTGLNAHISKIESHIDELHNNQAQLANTIHEQQHELASLRAQLAATPKPPSSPIRGCLRRPKRVRDLDSDTATTNTESDETKPEVCEDDSPKRVKRVRWSFDTYPAIETMHKYVGIERGPDLKILTVVDWESPQNRMIEKLAATPWDLSRMDFSGVRGLECAVRYQNDPLIRAQMHGEGALGGGELDGEEKGSSGDPRGSLF